MFGKIDNRSFLETSQFKVSLHLTDRRDPKTHIAGKRRSYLKERTKQREYLNSQIAHLDNLLKDNSIDENTYTRYKKLLEMNYEQKREATREKYGFARAIEIVAGIS